MNRIAFGGRIIQSVMQSLAALGGLILQDHSLRKILALFALFALFAVNSGSWVQFTFRKCTPRVFSQLMANKAKTIILVHPTVAIDYLFPFLKKHHYKILSIITRLENTQIETDYILEQSDLTFQGGKDPAEDLAEIQELIHTHRLEITAILNGLDASIYYADFLQNMLLGYPLDPERSKLRANKYEVYKILTEHNLPAIPSVEMTDLSNVQEKMEEIRQLGFPLIAKPSENTAVMAGVETLSSLQEISSYLDRYLGKPNVYYKDQIVKKIIVQKFIPLEEFIIDFISFEGKHYCCGIVASLKSTQEGDYRIDREVRTLALSEIPEIAPVVAYVGRCLDALGVQYGLTHNEVFWDRAHAFYLIESNSRFGGNSLIEMYEYTYGHNPVERYIELCSRKKVAGYRIDQHIGHCVSVELYNMTVPVAARLNVEDLPSFKRVIHFRKKDQNPPNFFKDYKRVEHICASVLLSHPIQQGLESDIKAILAREEENTLFLP